MYTYIYTYHYIYIIYIYFCHANSTRGDFLYLEKIWRKHDLPINHSRNIHLAQDLDHGDSPVAPVRHELPRLCELV